MVDKGIEGWLRGTRRQLDEKYSEIIQVGGHDFLDERASDDDIARFCKDNNCDLFTPDMKFHGDGFFKANIRTLKITNYDWWNKKYILLIQIVDST